MIQTNPKVLELAGALKDAGVDADLELLDLRVIVDALVALLPKTGQDAVQKTAEAFAVVQLQAALDQVVMKAFPGPARDVNGRPLVEIARR